jgi:hypothetical protein
MTYSNVEAKAVLYSLPGGDTAFSTGTISARGYATSASGAGLDGFGKIKNTLLAKLRGRLKDLK